MIVDFMKNAAPSLPPPRGTARGWHIVPGEWVGARSAWENKVTFGAVPLEAARGDRYALVKQV